MRPLPLRLGEGGVPLQSVVQIAGFAGSGGSAKQIIQAGLVRVNGQVETRRSHHVHAGDRIAFEDDEVELTHHAD